jgi:hypothetical protein
MTEDDVPDRETVRRQMEGIDRIIYGEGRNGMSTGKPVDIEGLRLLRGTEITPDQEFTARFMAEKGFDFDKPVTLHITTGQRPLPPGESFWRRIEPLDKDGENDES